MRTPRKPATSSSSSRSMPRVLKPSIIVSILACVLANISVSLTETRQIHLTETKRHGSVSQDLKPSAYSFEDKLLK
jgi:hypothetical protein